MRIVCDTNVLISAVIFGGRPRQVLEALIAGRVKGFISPALEREFREVLGRPKFGLTQPQVHRICLTLGDLLQNVYPKKNVSQIPEDPADNAVLACALEAGADYIVSGDAHLLNLGEFATIRIVQPADFLELLGS